MQIEASTVEVGDVVMDSTGKCWRYDGPGGAVQWSDFQMIIGSMSGPEPSGPGGEVTLLVRGGQQMCCTPSGTIPAT